MPSRTTGSETSRFAGFGDMSALLTTESKLWRSLGVDLPLRLTAEILSFGSRRLQAQAEHVAALGRCGSPVETIKLQTDFLMKTFTDYQHEADTLSRDMVDAAAPASGKAVRSAPA
ncbi:MULTISPECIES: phasin family protein [Methylobacterium]|uniref:phasin family protein n=1 Tax=Methylobacterium TaxID=407 RepID=UPI0013E9F6E6|nr:phasin family protein [Methylobacterium sp. DB0501]NGM35010.1 phasin family protein [Methylobacterium sp. DB0501]